MRSTAPNYFHSMDYLAAVAVLPLGWCDLMKIELASRQNRAFCITNRVTIGLSRRSTNRKTRTLGATRYQKRRRKEREKIF